MTLSRSAISLGLLVGCSSVDTATIAQPLAHPTSSSVPPSAGRLTMTGPRESGSTKPQGCHVVLIAPRWAVTAAHCFADFIPSGAKLTVLGLPIAPAEVHFHPNTYNGLATWTSTQSGPDPAFDVALVHLPADSGFSVAPIWHPIDPANALAAGEVITVTGSDDGFDFGEASGTMKFLGLLDFGDGWMIEADEAPSVLQFGDSGGGAFITAPSGSVPFADHCASPAAALGAQALIGINHSTGSTAYIVPLYFPDIVDWINTLTDEDSDDDFACDSHDNCPAVANADQENCNREAERAPGWGGAELGDACDPTPCAAPSQTETDFIGATTGLPKVSDGVLITSTYGRSIQNQLDVTPVLADGSFVTSAATPRFCVCRDATGAPIPDLDACAEAPFYCALDPKQENAIEAGGSGPPLAGQTYWHAITLETGLGSSIPLAYPGPLVSRTWDYKTDNTTWYGAGWIAADVVDDPVYGSGTTLAGWMWMHDPTAKGFATHGGAANPADAFAPAAPDARWVKTNAKQIPRYRPNPWWTYCGACGDTLRFAGEQVVDPAPFVTVDAESLDAYVWTAHGGSPATATLDERLRSALASRGSTFVGASEPAAVTRAAKLARQLQVASDGTAVLGAVVRGRTAFELQAIEAIGTGPTARHGFAMAWSRTAGALFLIGGTDARTGETLGQAWTWRPDVGFAMVRFDAANAPTDAETATFSPRDARMWILDRTRAGRRLIRLDPATGVVESVQALTFADDLDAAWLVTTADGHVLLVGAVGARHRVTRLDVPAFTRDGRVVEAARTEGEGAPLGAPAVANGRLHIAVAATAREGVTIRSMALVIP